ncbi:hypothetical protein EV644_113180 [Kribbella orskensis]|uniref:Uncharacterized protein n=1 Tax=Kribbella orskensis TaxID=2512216 RepID=A0ABY2BEN6_9ACTN|nr:MULTISPECIES: hypothetical protein [Kribbella]TCN36711.1 hypothetical protein EV642_114179 [Kribbella sp. VKM Ac-2500]TCO17950.1 hypothetical protein EV644_113180 [Kribbella orskensis]
MASFIRKVPTASGARAVQIVHKLGRRVVGIDHIGSAHDEAQLALLMEIARQRLHEGQGVPDFADTGPAAEASRSGARVSGMRSQLLWDVLAGTHARLGFDAIADEAFRALVLTRIIEPTSKADSLRVLEEIGVAAPALRTVFRALGGPWSDLSLRRARFHSPSSTESLADWCHRRLIAAVHRVATAR